MERTKFFDQSDQQNEDLLLEAFKSEGFLIVNKTLIKMLGLLPAILLANYIDKYNYFKEKFPNNKGWFFLTHEQQSEQLNIGEHVIRTNKHILIKKEILEIKMDGQPAKEWIKINFSQLGIAFRARPTKIRGLDLRKSEGSIYTTTSSIINTMKTNKEKKCEREIIPPPLNLVIKYCQERNNDIDPEEFINFYASKGWKVGNTKMVDWHAAMFTWEKNRKQNPAAVKKLEQTQDGKHMVNRKKWKEFDGMRYYEAENGEYYNMSGNLWID